MYILSIDTTAKTVSVCVCEKKEDGSLLPLSGGFANCGFTHSETLLPMIDSCLKNCGLAVENMDILACSAGPGSFTGVRIGVSCIKGISFALDSKGKKHTCVGVSSLEALATNLAGTLSAGTIVCPVMDARRSQFYNALFKVKRNGSPERLTPDRMPGAKELYGELCEKYGKSKIVLVGDGAPLCKRLFDELSEEGGSVAYSLCHPSRMYQDAYSVASVASAGAEHTTGKELSPVYLRASQAERERIEKENKR